MSSISVNVRFYGARKNVFHFRERSFYGVRKKCLPFPRMFVFRCKKKMSSISVNVRFYGAKKNVFHFRERENEKGGGEFGRNYFFVRCGCKKNFIRRGTM